ncbi:MAG: TetR/AcrR family transcriptional regulator [Frankiaceae bacterium]
MSDRGGIGEEGRRLDPERNRAIAAALIEVLAEVGYRGLTMDEIAMAAGVGKAAIYRRWASKSDLIVSYLDGALTADDVVVPDKGSLREDLLCLLTAVSAYLSGPVGSANRALVSALHEEPLLGEAFQRGPLKRWNGIFMEVLERAEKRGEIPAGASSSVAAETGRAILVHRWLITREPLDDQLVRALVDEVMLPLLSRA